jgi:hypothetical protein
VLFVATSVSTSGSPCLPAQCWLWGCGRLAWLPPSDVLPDGWSYVCARGDDELQRHSSATQSVNEGGVSRPLHLEPNNNAWYRNHHHHPSRLLLLARLHAAAHESAEYESCQRRAIDAQRLLLDRLRAECGGGGGGGGGGAGDAAVAAARGRLVELWAALAEHHARARHLEKVRGVGSAARMAVAGARAGWHRDRRCCNPVQGPALKVASHPLQRHFLHKQTSPSRNMCHAQRAGPRTLASSPTALSQNRV